MMRDRWPVVFTPEIYRDAVLYYNFFEIHVPHTWKDDKREVVIIGYKTQPIWHTKPLYFVPTDPELAWLSETDMFVVYLQWGNC